MIAHRDYNPDDWGAGLAPMLIIVGLILLGALVAVCGVFAVALDAVWT